MSITAAPFVDVEAALIVYLEDLGYGVTWTPANLKDLITDPSNHDAVLRIKRIGGGSTRTGDQPRISIQTYMLRRADVPRAAHRRAAEVEARIAGIAERAGVITIPAEYGGGTARLDSGEKESGPVELPYPDPAVLVVESLYRISTRR